MSCFRWCPCLPFGSDSNGKDTTAHRKSKPHLVYLNEQKVLQDVYDLGKLLGEGGFGKVWIATRTKDSGEQVAVKGVSCQHFGHAEYARVLDSPEVKAMQRLDHPNVCRIMETFSDESYLYLVMEFCCGGDLCDKMTDLVNAGSRLPVHDAASYMRQIFSAVAHMHVLDVGHFDLKLENVLLSGKDDRALCKVVDFGLAQQIKRGERKTSMIGSKYYIAPEILNESYDIRADNWSCGVIMYIFLTNEPPFNEQQTEIIYYRIREQSISFPTDAGENATNLLKSLLQRDVHARMTARRALRHAWFEEELGTDTTPKLPREILDGLESLTSGLGFKRLMWRAIIERTEDEDAQVQKFQEDFRILDSEGQGFLKVDDLMSGLEHLDNNPMELKSVLEEHVKRINDDGQLQYSDFIAALMVGLNHTPTEKALRSAFHFFDRSGMDAISVSDIERVLRFDDKKHETSAIIALIDQVDTDRDGKMSYNEFLAFLGIKTGWQKVFDSVKATFLGRSSSDA
mmetsp:Transcript_68932/g.119636  ORF Transcript_68932/g.119636 Transcript_68932/m.119636 type:complete len:513 (+) Transcript_68932:73-1611(+)